MATALDFTFEQPAIRRAQPSDQSTGSSLVSARLRLVDESCGGCEVVLSREEYDDFQERLRRPARVIPHLVELMRR